MTPYAYPSQTPYNPSDGTNWALSRTGGPMLGRPKGRGDVKLCASPTAPHNYITSRTYPSPIVLLKRRTKEDYRTLRKRSFANGNRGRRRYIPWRSDIYPNKCECIHETNMIGVPLYLMWAMGCSWQRTHDGPLSCPKGPFKTIQI